MNVTTDLTRTRDTVSVHRFPDDDFWYLEIWPNAEDGSENITLLADNLSDILLLGEAIVAAAKDAAP